MSFTVRKRIASDKPTGRKFKILKKIENPKMKQQIKKGRKLYV